ncbi:MAG: hypothetical protein RR581_06165 [Eubacterium sp.]
MEKRKMRIMFSKAGGNASKNAYSCKVSIPKKWLDEMKVTPNERDICLEFDGETIILKKDGEENENIT